EHAPALVNERGRVQRNASPRERRHRDDRHEKGHRPHATLADDLTAATDAIERDAHDRWPLAALKDEEAVLRDASAPILHELQSGQGNFILEPDDHVRSAIQRMLERTDLPPDDVRILGGCILEPHADDAVQVEVKTTLRSWFLDDHRTAAPSLCGDLSAERRTWSRAPASPTRSHR